MIFECDIVHVCRRSRLGAWIEIHQGGFSGAVFTVAPVWERGLKSVGVDSGDSDFRSLPFGSVD